MIESKFFSILCATVLLMVSTATNAEFFDRGGGLIYDNEQDLTWAKDAGLSGLVNWHEATDWVASLRLGGVDGWRLPTTTQLSDPTCGVDLRGTEVQDPYEHRRGCLGGEMEQLSATAGHYDYYTNTLGGTSGELFVNLYRKRYWTATPYREGIDPCIYWPDYDVPCTVEGDNGIRTDFYWQWAFGNLNGIGGDAYKTTMRGAADRYAWAVHDGDVGAPNLPGDINADGQVNVADYLLLTQCVLETDLAPTAEECNVGDMNQNGQPDAGDLVILSRTIMGLI